MRIPKRPKLSEVGERDVLMERVRGLVCLANNGSISKETEYAGFLALMNPELSADRRAALAKAMALEDE